MDTNTILISAGAMTVVGAGFLYFLQLQRKKQGASAVTWMGAGLSVMLIISSLVLMGVGLSVKQGNAFVKIEDGGEVQRESLGKEAPNFEFTLLDGDQKTDLAAYRGQVVLLNFWATWCPPCLDEMPGLNRLQADYKDQGVVVLTLSDETREEIDSFDQTKVTLDTESGLIADPTALPMPFLKILDGRPETYVIDRDGVLREFVLGARDYAYFERLVTPYL
ncbi:MAG: TlpA disulfide reductase family protein [Rhodothermales bacterium]|nr:TlpA disulfide reductase family protein [Rhodothermales bacterium]